MSDLHDAAVCHECGERQVRLRRALQADATSETAPRCAACETVMPEQQYREKRIADLLPAEPLPDDSGVVWSENLPETPEGEEGAVCLVLGPREWDALASRASLEFHEGVDIEVVKGRGPGLGFTHGDGGVGGVEVRLPGEAVKELHQTGRWSASVGGSTDPVHLKVVVLADA